MKPGEITGLLFETFAEPNLIQPTILYDFPTEISPLSKCRKDDPSVVERFEIYVAGMELGNAFSELNDPIEQERRFREQVEEIFKRVPSLQNLICIDGPDGGNPSLADFMDLGNLELGKRNHDPGQVDLSGSDAPATPMVDVATPVVALPARDKDGDGARVQAGDGPACARAPLGVV